MIVTTRTELEEAQESGTHLITVEGELASKLKTSKRVAKLGTKALAILIGVIGLSPFTSGLSFIALAPVAALTGIEIATIIVAASIGLTLIIAIFKDYEEISYEPGPPSKLVLRKKQRH